MRRSCFNITDFFIGCSFLLMSTFDFIGFTLSNLLTFLRQYVISILMSGSVVITLLFLSPFICLSQELNEIKLHRKVLGEFNQLGEFVKSDSVNTTIIINTGTFQNIWGIILLTDSDSIFSNPDTVTFLLDSNVISDPQYQVQRRGSRIMIREPQKHHTLNSCYRVYAINNEQNYVSPMQKCEQ